LPPFPEAIKHRGRCWLCSGFALAPAEIGAVIKTLTQADYWQESPAHANAKSRTDPTPEWLLKRTH